MGGGLWLAVRRTHHCLLPPLPAGEVFRVEMLDWTGGQIQDNDSAEDVKQVGGCVGGWSWGGRVQVSGPGSGSAACC